LFTVISGVGGSIFWYFGKENIVLIALCLLYLKENKKMAQRITVHYEEKPIYDIVIERDYRKLADEIITLDTLERKLCIVTESTVGGFYAEKVRESLLPVARQVEVFTFLAGEASKNLDTVQKLYEFLILHNFERKDMLLALGGGVVGDLTGYTAATYLRGVDFVQLPTSLLAQVDSSIGGKTGVDFNCYKNMVGAFYQPKLVYMNLEVLNSLTEREYLSGMGEIIKHGLIKDKSYYQWLLAHMTEIRKRNPDILEKMIAVSCQIKRDVVERDPKEKGERALLNFGHTLGHAIERLMNFSLLHGECVGLGMLAACRIGVSRGQLTEQEYQEVFELLKVLGMPVAIKGLSAREIVAVSKNDKKMEQGKIKFVLLQETGQAYVDRTVSDKEMEEALCQIGAEYEE